jgi:hypothetical protein
MQHLSEWHIFDARDRQTCPKVNAYIQVKYGNKKVSVGYSHDFFPASGLLSDSLNYGLAIHQGGGSSCD